ncbi:MAG: class I SAM-dependent methyltransferase [Rhodospirillales bacterium]|nr:MAG: class I SAM-dependent methyltransferase [Rhodospirillales bacterium]
MAAASAFQDKSKEIAFFDGHAGQDSYDVFSPETNERIVEACLGASGFPTGGVVADLGCGSGVFGACLARRGFRVLGVDLSQGLLQIGARKYPEVRFLAGDVDRLPFADSSLDGVLLSGIIHHLPDPSACAREVFRVLKPGAGFAAFDPNRLNPFMYLYRDRSSPFYSSKGVTENERPVLAGAVAEVFAKAGFAVRTSYLSGLKYRYVASNFLGRLLPLYNVIDDLAFRPDFLKRLRVFVLTSGQKP